MTTLKHPVGATQLEISRIVLDIFRFHQSKWLQFSIKMLNLGPGLGELGRKYDAVSIDDKWPSFDWTNREIRDQNNPHLFQQGLHGDLRVYSLGHTLRQMCSDKIIRPSKNGDRKVSLRGTVFSNTVDIYECLSSYLNSVFKRWKLH